MILVATVAAMWFVCARGDLLQDMPCATLYSEPNFGGESFQLLDFDQSANLRRDYRPSKEGWRKTGSVRLENGCTVATCSGTYFQGSCSSITASKNAISDVLSLNCSCKRECTCSDITVPDHDDKFGEFGRGYFVGQECSSCHKFYVSLDKENWFPDEHEEPIGTFALRHGCNLTLYSEPDYEGEETLITQHIYQGYNDTFGSYRFSCDGSPYTPPHADDFNENYPTMMDIPETKDLLVNMLREGGLLENHEGLKQALMSAKSGRSFRNVYVVLIGHYRPFGLGLTQCQDNAYSKIGECRITFRINRLGITTQLRVITVPVGGDSILQEDDELMASLSEYLKKNEELHNAIPNAVVVYHWIGDTHFTVKGDAFQRKLEVLRALRSRLVDRKHSNVVFLLFILPGMATEDETQPEARISEFEAELEEWALPKPIQFCVRATKQPYMQHVNGFLRMANGEYWPRNMQVSIENICNKSGDMLGKAVFRQAYQDQQPIGSRVESLTHEVPPESIKVQQFYQFGSISTALESRSIEIDRSIEDLDDDEEHFICVEIEKDLNDEVNELKAEWERIKNDAKKDEQRVNQAVLALKKKSSGKGKKMKVESKEEDKEANENMVAR